MEELYIAVTRAAMQTCRVLGSFVVANFWFFLRATYQHHMPFCSQERLFFREVEFDRYAKGLLEFE